MPTPLVAHKCRYLSWIFAVHGQEGNCIPTPPVAYKCGCLYLISAVHNQKKNCMPTSPVAHECGYLPLNFAVHSQEENCMPTPPVPHKCRYLSLIFAVHGQEGYYMPTPPGQGWQLHHRFPWQFPGALNPLQLTISESSLHTSLNTFPKALTRRICLALELPDVTVNSPLELLHIFYISCKLITRI